MKSLRIDLTDEDHALLVQAMASRQARTGKIVKLTAFAREATVAAARAELGDK